MKLVKNYVNGSRIATQNIATVINPLNGNNLFRVCDTSVDELSLYIKEFNATPEYGLHNPLYNRERYMMYGQISRKLANLFDDRQVYQTLFNLIQSCVPKSDSQVASEILVTKRFLENFSGDQVRFMARGCVTAGDYDGQQSIDYIFPYGKVCIITPFNYPLEIPVLQLMGALFLGNKPVLHVDLKVSQVMDYFIDLLLESGMPKDDLIFINGRGVVINEFLKITQPKNTLFTGSSTVAEKLAIDLAGKIKIEGGGFDWKILDINNDEIAVQCDIDAYEFGKQKCSAQSILFLDKKINLPEFVNKLKALADKRSLEQLTIVPLLSINNTTITNHIDTLLHMEGGLKLFGEPISSLDSKIPEQFGCYRPTLIYLPLTTIMKKENFKIVTKEIFGPVQIITDYNNIDDVIECINQIEHKLTAAIVSENINFIDYVSGRTINGTTYTGIKARTTGAPQNHWFGPGGDPRGGALGTPEAIRHVWGFHRVITQGGTPPLKPPAA